MFHVPRNYNGGKKILINFKNSSQYNTEAEQSWSTDTIQLQVLW